MYERRKVARYKRLRGPMGEVSERLYGAQTGEVPAALTYMSQTAPTRGPHGRRTHRVSCTEHAAKWRFACLACAQTSGLHNEQQRSKRVEPSRAHKRHDPQVSGGRWPTKYTKIVAQRRAMIGSRRSRSRTQTQCFDEAGQACLRSCVTTDSVKEANRWTCLARACKTSITTRSHAKHA